MDISKVRALTRLDKKLDIATHILANMDYMSSSNEKIAAIAWVRAEALLKIYENVKENI